MLIFRYTLCLFILWCSQSVLGQTVKRCGTDQRIHEVYDQAYIQQITSDKSKLLSKHSPKRMDTKTIAVHVVIVHPTGQAIGTGANLSYEQIQSQIEVLNVDYNQDGGTNTPDEFSTGNPQIRFCLASVDPNGNETDGITRYAFDGESFDAQETEIKLSTGWDNTKYLNIWTSSVTTNLGLAYVPSTNSIPNSNVDGVIVNSNNFGTLPYTSTSVPYHLGRTATHEIGHYLGLCHVWGCGDGGCSQDDGFDDTPIQAASNFGCPIHPSPSCANDGDMFMNFMDYSNDECMTAFSAEQVAYMNLILETSRASLINAAPTLCSENVEALAATITSVEQNVCFDDTMGQITVSASGGKPPYTFTTNDLSNQSGTFSALANGDYIITVTDSDNNSITLNQTITSNPRIITNATVNQPIQCFGETGDVFIATTGGSGVPYTYILPDGTTSQSSQLTNLAADTYVITITDANQCSSTEQVILDQPDNLVLSYTADEPECINIVQSITINATGGTQEYVYAINGNETQTVENVPTGIYQGSVTDANGCTATTTIDIPIIQELTLSTQSTVNATCGQANGSVTITSNGGTAPVTYSLNQTTTTDGIFSDLSAGVYEVTAIDINGCTANYEITINNEVTDFEIMANYEANCDGSATVNIETTSSNSDELLYSINGNDYQASPIFINLIAQIYTVYVKDANDCTVTDMITVTVNEPLEIVNFIKTDETCAEAADGTIDYDIIGGVAPFTLSVDNNAVNQTAQSNLSAGNHTIIIEDANGCTTTQMVSIAAALPIEITTTMTINESCLGDDASLTVVAQGGTGQITYSLNQASNTSGVFNNLNAGFYILNVSDTNGCTLSSNIAINADTEVNIELVNKTNATCYGETGAIEVDLVGVGINYQLWLNDETITDTQLNELTAGDYQLILTGLTNCSDTLDFVINEPDQIDTTNVSIINVSDTPGHIYVVPIGGVAPYVFSIDGVNYFPTTDDFNLEAGDYTLRIKDANDCERNFDFTIQIESSTIDDISLSIAIVPNPTTGLCIINNIAFGSTIEIYTSDGQSVSDVDIVYSGDSARFNLRNQVEGLYLVCVRFNDGSIKLKRVALTQ